MTQKYHDMRELECHVSDKHLTIHTYDHIQSNLFFTFKTARLVREPPMCESEEIEKKKDFEFL